MVSPIGHDAGVSEGERKEEKRQKERKRGGEYVGGGCGEIDEGNWRG